MTPPAGDSHVKHDSVFAVWLHNLPKGGQAS